MGQHPGAGRGLHRNLKTMRDHFPMPLAPTVLYIIVDRMIVTGGQLKGCKIGITQSS